MDRISATIITRNEEANLDRCLNALKGVADEIVVVDSYSTDRSVEICERYGCKVSRREFAGFGSQRQYATGLTSHAYVLSIDADEVLDEELRSQIIAMKQEGFKHRVYDIEVQNYFCGVPLKHSGFSPSRSVRLFNKRYANWNLRDISDKVSYPEGVIPESLGGAIHHFRCASLKEFNRKENRLAALESRILTASTPAIGALAPLLRGLRAYIKCMIGQSAWLDGKAGLTIARRRAVTAYQAWRMARHMLRAK
ncbi:MAG: glycosyltransferase family 2 protein [Muribaculaceae bacterium]|nr:glycosyltransferase family 2 protein [Muribaculaceae bacterium]